MNLYQAKEVSIPPALWKLHGKKAYQTELILTYLLAILVMLFNLAFSRSLPVWKIVILAVLSIDIGGGVVSNFTKSTIRYYREHHLSPHAFVWSHLLQSALLLGIFLEFRSEIVILSFCAMLFSSVTVIVYNTHFQKQISVLLFTLVVLVMRYYTKIPNSLYVLLMLMAFKLIVGFAAHWKNEFDKMEN
ncbi:hypothetical protein [Dyadobacter crusticola]|uniref:hypothetical protein n=1 Tax=Dyadobacter crusticola TaxID=292407 RepID=UPI000AD5D935|nr:hypothetical protein [Dyadobacter crusticola]